MMQHQRHDDADGHGGEHGVREALGALLAEDVRRGGEHRLLPPDAADDEVGGHVDDEGDAEQQDADEEQHTVVLGSLADLTHLGRDVRRERAHRARARSRESAPRARWPSARPSSRRPRGPRRAAPRPAGRSSLPAAARGRPVASAWRQARGLPRDTSRARPCSASSPIDTMIGTLIRASSRPAFSTLRPTGASKSPDDQVVHHGEADEPPHHRGNRGQQLDDDLQRLAQLRRAELRHVDRRADAERHRDEHRERGDRQRAGDHRAPRRSGCRVTEVGYHSMLNRNSRRLKCSADNAGAASRNTKKKMPSTSTIALTPQSRDQPLHALLGDDGPPAGAGPGHGPATRLRTAGVTRDLPPRATCSGT